MTSIQKKNRFFSAILFSFLFSISSVNGQDELALDGGTDLSLEDLVFVKVTVASKSEESVADASGVVSVITQDQLKRFGGTTLGDVLKRVPSLLGTTVYMTDRSVISARGDQIMPSSSHILLLINGRPIREVLEGGIKSEVYETFPVNVIERIEVIRGPGSVLYGSQAFSGVINIVTKSGDYNSFSVSGALGENLHNNISANINYKFGDFGLVLAGRYADQSGWKTNWQAPNILGGVDNVKVRIPDYGPGLFGELSYKGLHAMCSFNQWTHQYFVPDFQFAKGDPIIMPYGDATGRIIWSKLFGDIGYEHTFNDFYSSSINATYTRSLMETQMFPWTSRDGYEIIVEQTNFFTPVENFNITLGEVWGFITGEEGDARDETVFFHKDKKQNTFSGYLQLDYRWSWLKAIGGIQMNKVGDFKMDFNPRAGLIFYPLENINVKTLYSTAYRAPSLDELYLDNPVMRGQMIERTLGDGPAENNLDPEKVNTFDIGVNYQDSTVQFGINGFHSQMKKLIIQDRSGKYDIPTWDNIGEATIFGLECEGKVYLTKELLFEGSFLYQESKDEKSQEKNVTPLPTFSAKGGLSYMGHGLTLSAYNSYWQALDSKYSSDLNTTTGHFNMVNLYCAYNFNELIGSEVLKELSLVLSVDNLLDEEVWLPAWGLINGSRIPYNEGRVVYGGFKFTF